MATIRKAIIPAAGYGLNFLPATKAQPKELLPIVDKPAIQFVVEEAKQSGIEEILIITGKHKRAIEDHFDANVELEQNLESKGKIDLLNIARGTTYDNIFYVRQSEPKGLAHAIYHAKAFVGNEPFLVMLGDNIMEGTKTVTQQLLSAYEEVQRPIIVVNQVEPSELSRYGVIDMQDTFDSRNLARLKRIIEKPDDRHAPSQYAVSGRYILTPEIFDIIAGLDKGVDDEYQLTDALDLLNQQQPVYAYLMEGKRHDTGYKIGFLKSSIQYGLKHPETREELTKYLIKKSQNLKANK